MFEEMELSLETWAEKVEEIWLGEDDATKRIPQRTEKIGTAAFVV